MKEQTAERGGAPMRSRGKRIARAAATTVVVLAVAVALYALVVWALAPHVRGALLGPLGPVVAFLVGAVSFFTPCILPLVPGYLSYISGLSGEEMDLPAGRKRVLGATLLFVLGFAVMFTSLGLALTWLGQTLLGNQVLLTRIGGAIVIVMGLAFLAPGLVPMLERERRPFLSKVKPGVAGAFPLGLAFAIGWSPCVGPGFGAIVTLGYAEGSTARAALLLFSFCLGFGIWFVLSGMGIRRVLAATTWMRSRARTLQMVGGALMLVLGVLLVTDVWDSVIAPLRRLTNQFSSPL